KAGLGKIKCTNCAVGDIPADASLVVCQRELAERARLSGKEVLAITNFLADPALDALLDRLSTNVEASAGYSVPAAEKFGLMPPDQNNRQQPEQNTRQGAGDEIRATQSEQNTWQGATEVPMLMRSNVLTGLPSESKEEAILRAGALLEAAGYVDEKYAPAMLEREGISSTYMGMGLAIPHGTAEAKGSVLRSGIVVLQYPEGVDFDGEKARLIVGIAGVGDEHLSILAKVAGALDDEALLEKLSTTPDPEEIYKTLQ
ncbi:MAG: PTS sugar transporter subunit IIA, partial [Bacteroidales bacterium]|nr:PTS sugar transporter subunit IIA [Bacteroidales bacterium]